MTKNIPISTVDQNIPATGISEVGVISSTELKLLHHAHREAQLLYITEFQRVQVRLGIKFSVIQPFKDSPGDQATRVPSSIEVT